jgi:hypothetical protein
MLKEDQIKRNSFMRKTIKVEYKKLGKKKLWAQALFETNTIELDVRAKGKKHLELLNHEGLHILLPTLNEDEIVRISTSLTDLLWKENYRRTDENEDTPMQDGDF